MRISIYKDFASIPLTHAEWNALVSQNETNTVFQTYEWIKSWWETFGDNYELFFITVAAGNDIIGFSPLMITSSDAKRKLVFIGDNNSDYLDFVILTKYRKDTIQQIIDTISNNNNKWDMVLLRNIPKISSTYKDFTNYARRSNTRFIIDDSCICPSLVIDSKSEAIELLNKYSFKRPYNYFRRHGNLEHRIFDKAAEIDQHLDEFFSQHINRWKSTSSKSLFTQEENKQFYRKLAHNMIETGWLLFSCIEMNGTKLSFHFGFDYNGKVLWYKPSYNTEYSNHSPGLLMIWYLLRYAIENERHELDFSVGNEKFKYRFSNREFVNINLYIFKDNKSYWLEKIWKFLVKLSRVLRRL